MNVEQAVLLKCELAVFLPRRAVFPPGPVSASSTTSPQPWGRRAGNKPQHPTAGEALGRRVKTRAGGWVQAQDAAASETRSPGENSVV